MGSVQLTWNGSAWVGYSDACGGTSVTFVYTGFGCVFQIGGSDGGTYGMSDLVSCDPFIIQDGIEGFFGTCAGLGGVIVTE